MFNQLDSGRELGQSMAMHDAIWGCVGEQGKKKILKMIANSLNP
jgi:hypothetical protein